MELRSPLIAAVTIALPEMYYACTEKCFHSPVHRSVERKIFKRSADRNVYMEWLQYGEHKVLQVQSENGCKDIHLLTSVSRQPASAIRKALN